MSRTNELEAPVKVVGFRTLATLASSFSILLVLSLGAVAQDATLSLRTTRTTTGVQIPTGIVNAGVPDVKIQGITINKKKSDDPRCSYLIYEWTDGSKPSIMSEDTARAFIEGKLKPSEAGVTLSTGQSLTINEFDVIECGVQPIYVDIETDAGTFSWNLTEEE